MTAPTPGQHVVAPTAEPGPLEQAQAHLDALPTTPLDEHPAVFTAVDSLLRAALDAVDGVAAG
jgi:hypothetical protein